MPSYLCHGFRWSRKSIRYFVVLHDIDDAAPEWIVAPRGSVALLETFYELFDFLPQCSRPRSSNARDDQRLGATTSSTASGPSQVDPCLQHKETDRDNRAAVPADHARQKGRSEFLPLDASGNGLPKTSRRDGMPSSSPSAPPNDGVLRNDWSVVKLLEEFDPADESVLNGTWAYVSDHVVRVDTSCSIMEEMLRYEERSKAERHKAMSGPSDETGRKTNTVGNKKAGWFEKLRDQLQRGEDIRWYVVVCGDEERANSVHGNTESRGGEVEQPRNGVSGGGYFEDGFEFRLPEFADLGISPQQPTPELTRRMMPSRSPDKLTSSLASVPDKERQAPPPLQSRDAKLSIDSSTGPKTPKGGFRKLFSSKRSISESPA